MRRLVSFLLALAAVGAAPIAEAATLTVGGVARTYELHVPVAVAAARQPVPLIIVLHGGMGHGAQMRQWFGLDSIADRDQFIAAYPDGLSRNWNDGRAAVGSTAPDGTPADDVTFLSALAKELVTSGQAKAGRIYVTGASNGGMMVYRLACETRDIFAGYAAMIANLSVELMAMCRPSQPAAMLIMNGTNDPLMPFEGGSVARNTRGAVISTAATVTFWRKANGCTATGPVVRLPQRAPADATHVTLTQAEGCTAAAPVHFYTVAGGGHQMPSQARASRPLVDRLLGPNNRDIEAADVIARFFLRN